jgi:X-Pro dipeptidyl-peptidase
MRAHPRLARATLGVALLAATLAPALPVQAAVVVERFQVPTRYGATIRVEIRRDPALDPQPVLLTYSPYNSLSEPSPTNDGYATRYVPRGIARAVADVIGTRGSTGCWDYGGLWEQQSGVDVVRWLASRPWSTGRVGMIGGSYNGTTANMVAATGIPELKAIVPISSISRWYGYAYWEGVRYFLNSRAPADEGFDTPLAFDYGFARTVAPDDPDAAGTLLNRKRQCERAGFDHTEHGYSRSPDYTAFWQERDYRKDADRFRAAVLMAHGWQDYNVKQEESIGLWPAIPTDDPQTEDQVEGVPFKLLVMTQGTHGGGTSIDGWQDLLDRFLDHTLKGIDNGVEDEARVRTIGRTAAGANTAATPAADWPPPGTGEVKLYLGRKFDTIPGVPSVGPAGTTGEYGWLEVTPQNTGGGWAHTTMAAITEEITLRDPLNRKVAEPNGQPVRGHGYYSLFQESRPLARDVRVAGSAVLDAWVNPNTASQHLTPLLVEILPDGTLNLVERGFLNLDYRNGLSQAQPLAGWQHATVTFLPQDYTFKAGNRIGLMLQGSNAIWAVPGNPGLVSYAMGPVAGVTPVGAHLSLPVVGPPQDPATLFAPGP